MLTESEYHDKLVFRWVTMKIYLNYLNFFITMYYFVIGYVIFRISTMWDVQILLIRKDLWNMVFSHISMCHNLGCVQFILFYTVVLSCISDIGQFYRRWGNWVIGWFQNCILCIPLSIYLHLTGAESCEFLKEWLSGYYPSRKK